MMKEVMNIKHQRHLYYRLTIVKKPIYQTHLTGESAQSRKGIVSELHFLVGQGCPKSVQEGLCPAKNFQTDNFVVNRETFCKNIITAGSHFKHNFFVSSIGETFALNADRWYQHYTKTAYVSGLPEKNIDIDESVFSELRSAVCNSILQEHWYMKKGRTFAHREQEHSVAPCLRNIVCALKNVLAKENPVLVLSSLDFDPQVNFYWLRGERTIPRGHRSGRVEPMRFQIDDKPHSQIRIPKQLPEFVPLEADISAEVPVVQSAPDLLPLFRRQYDNNIFIGTKLEDPCCYGHTQFHMVPDRFRRDKMSKRGLSDQVEVMLRANSIASLFAWTGAQAMYQGFWSEEDVSRPFVSQAVITDGQYFSFFCYQLNTLALTQRSEDSNVRKNLCWGSESMRLYESVTDGDVVGWNDAVLRLLVQFLMNKP
ncbi:28S ribosomal protein S30, mitochondrial [Triplophysa tibetana]|uniref:28S ribosomal protein S30, mitochondrial n=1 Tax=Triplophysa tibetana TaxID=1572043 RepID=A0A5A9P379_9TELE|nr:28S ribosomal protein S30, mitochondrial [Triplophysa tibetana]